MIRFGLKMKFMIRSILGVMMAAALGIAIGTDRASAQSDRKPFDHAGLAQRALEGHILPSYGRLGEATKSLEAALRSSCETPGRVVPPAVVAAYDEVVSRWGAVEHVNFGPVTVNNRVDRFFFFPDRRGLGARQVAKALEAKEAGLLDAAVLGERSVGIQSLSALDIVLFDPARKDITDPNALAYRCRYALAIAGNLDRIARDVLRDWADPDGYRKQWLEPGPGNAAFQKPSETTMTLAKSLLQGIERVRDERIGGPLGFGKRRQKSPPALQTGSRTFRLIDGNIDGLIDLYRNGGIQDAIRQTQPDDTTDGIPAIARLVETEMQSARGVARSLIAAPKPFDTPATMQRLIAIGFPLKNARDQAMGLLTLTAGLTLGFNASDGD